LTTWAVRGLVTSPRATSWAVLEQVTSDRSTAWTVSASVVVPISTTWAVLVTVTATRSTTWDVTEPDAAHDVTYTVVLLPRGWSAHLAADRWAADMGERSWQADLGDSRWASDLIDDRWEASLTCQTDTIQEYLQESTEFAVVEVRRPDGSLVTTGVQVCVLLENTRPTEADWEAAVELDGKIGVMVTGLALGTYKIWTKVASTPEDVVDIAGTIRVV
jgi:hypothetical protein